MTEPTSQQQAQDRALESIERNSMLLRAVTLVVGVAVLVVVIVYGQLERHDTQTSRARFSKEIGTLIYIEGAVRAATDPSSALSRQGAAHQAVVVRDLIVCLENHENRLAALLGRTREPAALKGCP